MATFTSDEIQAVIEKLVKSSIRRPTDTLGVRRTDVTFNDIQESAAGVFLLYQRTPYFFVSLGSTRQTEAAQAAGAICEELLAALAVLRRRVVPIKDITALSNAKSALLELEASVSKSGPPKDLSKVPAYVRFNSNVDRFLNAVGNNIKDKGAIVPTPQEARGAIPGLVASLKTAIETLESKVGYLSLALKDYGTLNLPQLVSAGVISRARQVLGDRVTELEGLSEVERLAVLRDTVLELLGTKAVVKKFGQFVPPSSITTLTGTGAAYADADRPANEAFLDSDKTGPYALVAGLDASTSTNVLYLYADGAPSYPAAPTTQFFLPLSPWAKIEGIGTSPYNIVAGTNDKLYVVIGLTTYPITLTAGVARTATQVAADITAGLVGSNYKAEAYFAPLMYEGEVTASGNTLSLAFGSYPTGSLQVGDEVDIYYGVNAPTTRTVTVSGTNSVTVDGAALTGGTCRIRSGAALRKVRIVPINKTQAVTNYESIKLDPQNDQARNAGITLGMYGSQIGRSSPTDAETIASFVGANSTRFRAETYFVDNFGTTLLRSEPSDAFTTVAYYVRDTASWGAGTLGVTVTLANNPGAAGGTLVGRTIVLRDGAQPNITGLVMAQAGAVLTVNFTGAVTSATGLVELGPSIGFTKGQVVTVSSGPNAGKYFVDTPHATIPFQCKLRSLMPIYRDGFNQPLLMTGQVGSEGVRFFSRSTALTSKIEIRDPLTVFMNAIGPTSAVGTTLYFKLPSRPNDLEAGDVLDFYTVDYDNPTSSRSVVLTYADSVVKLDTAIASTLSYPLGPVSLPFALLRAAKVISYDAFAKKLVAWLALKDLDTKYYFTDLNRFLQPLLANENPTDSDVGSAENRVRDVYKLLTEAGVLAVGGTAGTSLEGILGTFSSPFVAEADALIRAFKEKGADRAVDILLDCRFTVFFGLDQDETSYAGAFQKSVRSVAMNDLPIRKAGRDAATTSQLRSSAESPDYETDSSDLDQTPNIDPPVQVD